MFSLTEEERRVSLFFIAVALIGMGVSFLLKINAAAGILKPMGLDTLKVDLNKADKYALMEIPGIGEKLSQRIMEYRSKQGVFKEIEELKNIKGITDSRYEKIKDAFSISR